MPDMLTVGQGGLSQGQYRVEFFTWAILSSPLILGCDIRTMDSWSLSLVTNPEILAVNQDKECIQASLARLSGSVETWIKPISDGSFAVVLLNKGTSQEQTTVFISDEWHTGGGDFYPAELSRVSVRDLYQRKDIGQYSETFTATIAAQDASIFRFTLASINKIGRAVQQECRDRSRMPSSA
eukprot:TRINITY_DN55530_c0_g1_i3.p1 TRINITY_DN55530_c0_g1~~TRINITY_DN55530_c0_g1_i3.p1  ORF type:complete len:182 (+),score=15.29 TRINITY_DN55530_c0_g1_i3:116-661(+)